MLVTVIYELFSVLYSSSDIISRFIKSNSYGRRNTQKSLRKETLIAVALGISVWVERLL